MAYWRKHQGVMGHRGFSSFNRKPPLPLDISIRHSTLPSWEKKFFHSICSIPWKKFVENQKYMHINRKVMNWEDSAVKEAFESAKMRFWGKLNNLPCSLPLPDPDIYIDKVDWDASVDPKLLQDLEREEIPSEEERGGEVVILGTSLLLNHAYSGAGWGDDDEEEVTKLVEAAQGWESSPQENTETISWEQNYVPFEPVKESIECKNESNLYQNNETNSWISRIMRLLNKRKDTTGGHMVRMMIKGGIRERSMVAVTFIITRVEVEEKETIEEEEEVEEGGEILAMYLLLLVHGKNQVPCTARKDSYEAATGAEDMSFVLLVNEV